MMLTSISGEVGAAIAIAPVAASALPDVFEAYVFSLIIRAARQEAATITFVNRHSAPATELRFRTGPGQIYSASDYTHAIVQFKDRPALECHVGIKVAGKSGELHEIDVSVLDRAEAELCRINGFAPRSSRLLIAVECKYYTSSLQLHLARGFLGLVADTSADHPSFVTNTSSTSVEKLLSHRARNCWESNVVPMNTEVDRLIHYFRAAFKNYKAK